jgi:hypothetical protein
MVIISLCTLATCFVLFLLQFVYCQVCCEPFHKFCLEENERPLEDQLENWCCRRCKFCHVCGRQHQATKVDRVLAARGFLVPSPSQPPVLGICVNIYCLLTVFLTEDNFLIFFSFNFWKIENNFRKENPKLSKICVINSLITEWLWGVNLCVSWRVLAGRAV